MPKVTEASNSNALWCQFIWNQGHKAAAVKSWLPRPTGTPSPLSKQMPGPTLLHVFDAIARDQRILRATEEEVEVEYLDLSDLEEDEEFIGRRRRKPQGGGPMDGREFVIHLFGCLADGTPARIEVTGFKPFFFVELPDCTTPTDEQKARHKLQQFLQTKAPKEASSAELELEHKQKLYGYTGGRTFPFVKITVPSLGHFYNLRKIFLDENQTPRTLYKVYEANIDPMLRFFHLRGLEPCGWMKVMGEELESQDSTLLLRAEWVDISPSVAPPGCVTAPFHHAFWDIECYSHDGEFPVAKQGYRRVAKQIWTTGETDPQVVLEGLVSAFDSTDSRISIPPLLKPTLKPSSKEIRAAFSKASVRKLEEILKGRESLNGKEREERVVELTKLLDSALGNTAPIAGDPIIQVGTVCIRGSSVERHIFVLGTCDPVEGAVVHSVKTEKDLLLKWFEWAQEKNFDVFCGYNIFGFDERYLWERLEELGLEQEESVQRLTRLFDEGGQVKLETKMLSSSALGDNQLHMWTTPGRLRIDLYGHIKRKSQMPSYKLDAVAAAFLSGKLSTVVPHGEKKWLLKTKQKGDARVGRYVQILDELGEDLTEKAPITEITADGLVVESEEDYRAIAGEAARWAIVKDDVPPQELFRLHREGGSAGRARIASYCIQDCDLVYELYKKLDVFNEAMSMANVCSVPVGYIFVRGQGIKIESLIFKDCMAKNQLIQVMPSANAGLIVNQEPLLIAKKALVSATKAIGGEEVAYAIDNNTTHAPPTSPAVERYKQAKASVKQEEGRCLYLQSLRDDSYEGAIVLDPEPGFYTDSPVGVCDFASLYPSTIISENISHDMLVWVKDYDLNGKLLAVIEGSDEDEKFAPPGTRWTDIEFDIWRPDPSDTRKHPVKMRAGTRICRYAQSPTGQGSLPQIVAKLLAARKAKRAEIPKTDDPFKKALLDAEQNAYKITANSLYGQLGSRTFKIRLQHLAASVTAYGRKQILFSKAAIEKFYGPAAGRPDCSAKIVYGDTDSIFVAFHPKGPDGTPLEGREAIVKTIELTEEAGKFITGALRAPHDFEYDKIFYPFIIFSKKRYVGNKYEENPDEFKETSMGIVLKRRDNAPLLKMTYGAAIDALLNRRDVAEATEAVKAQVKELVEGKMKLSQLTITKSLRAEYMGSPPAHKVLADRIKARDPGNAPASGERIGFVYIKPPTGQEASRLQGDRVETPQFIVENKLQPDAEYYIDHQLTNPLSQLFGLLLEKMPGYQPPSKWNADPEKRITERELLAADLLFREGLQACRQQATRAFLAKMGATTTASAGLATNRRSVRPPPSAPLPEAVVKKQTTLAAFLKDTSGFNDQLLAREMRTAKRKAKQNDK